MAGSTWVRMTCAYVANVRGRNFGFAESSSHRARKADTVSRAGASRLPCSCEVIRSRSFATTAARVLPVPTNGTVAIRSNTKLISSADVR
jgi:hypothetical protein